MADGVHLDPALGEVHGRDGLHRGVRGGGVGRRACRPPPKVNYIRIIWAVRILAESRECVVFLAFFDVYDV